MENHGGRLITGGNVNVETCWVEPTVILNPSSTSALYNNEVFGPIMKVKSFTAIDEVIYEINWREKPLALYYFGKAIGGNANKDRIENETSSGMLVINDVGT